MMEMTSAPTMTTTTMTTWTEGRFPRYPRRGDVACDDGIRGRRRHHYHHFDASHVSRFHETHNDRQGIAVLGFEVRRNNVNDVGVDDDVDGERSSLDIIFDRYDHMHPMLIPGAYRSGPITYAADGM